MDDVTTTQKLVAVTQENELQYYEKQFRNAGEAMLANPTMSAARTYEQAQAKLIEVEDLYREGYRALLAVEVEKKTRSQILHTL